MKSRQTVASFLFPLQDGGTTAFQKRWREGLKGREQYETEGKRSAPVCHRCRLSILDASEDSRHLPFAKVSFFKKKSSVLRILEYISQIHQPPSIFSQR